MTARIAAFELVTRDAGRLAEFYTRALGCTRTAETLMLGAQVVRLRTATGRAYPADSTAADLWFQHLAIVTTDINVAVVQAVSAGAVPITCNGPQVLPQRSGGVTAWKFRDPEGHPLELLQFPAHAVPPAWRGAIGLHLGIDHSAISVADVNASIDYYQRRFGCTVTARQTNYGAAQSRLDGIADARVEVVALQTPGAPTPHLELLGYRPPGRGSDSMPDDVAATAIVMRMAAGTKPGEARDPDGHRACWPAG